MIINNNEIKLIGKWYQIAFEEAFNGAIGKLFFDYTNDLENDHIFYGISAHNDFNSFGYFIGENSEEGEVILPKGKYYEVKDVSHAYDAYLEISKLNLDVKQLFDASKYYDELPTKIEVYRYYNNEVTLEKILIPLK